MKLHLIVITDVVLLKWQISISATGNCKNNYCFDS